MDEAGQCGTAGLRPVRVGAAFGVFHQNVAHGIDIHVASRSLCRQSRRRQRVPARIIQTLGRVVFGTPVDDENRSFFGAGARGGETQFRLRVVDDQA